MLGIVILNWNGGADTLDALHSLYKADLPPQTRILVADNGSTDNSPAAIRSAFPNVLLRENGANLGFAGGCNRAWQALADAGATTIFFLNNDAIIAPDAITRLQAALESDSEIGAVSPRIYTGEGPESGTATVWFEKACTTPDSFSIAAHIAATDEERVMSIYDTEAVCGCALMISTKTLRRAEGFDEALFAYYEDADLSLRLRRRFGLRLAVVPGASVWHKVSRSTGGAHSPTSAFYIARNSYRVAQKNGTPEEWNRFRRRFVRSCIGQARYFTRGGASPFNERSGGATLQGGFCALRGQIGLRPQLPEAPFIAAARLLAQLP